MRTRSASAFIGILGWPLEHTLSPAIHNAAFRRLGLDWVYLTFPVPPTALGGAIEGLRALGARGANVTMPHKETCVAYLDGLSGDARSLQAVNTIQEVAGKLIGHNTDVDGFAAFLEGDVGFDPRGRSALILGAGGAARAVVKALADKGTADIAIAARSQSRADALTELAGAARAVPWADASGVLAGADLVVNATPLGMNGEDVLPEAHFRGSQVVVDLVYEPPMTPLIERARASGAGAWSGLGMLVHQAVAAFRIWTGQEPPVETMSAAALHSINRGG